MATKQYNPFNEANQIVTLNAAIVGKCTSNRSCYRHNNEKEDMRCKDCCYLVEVEK